MNNPQQKKTALVLGLGASGRAAAVLLADRGWDVLAVDSADNTAVRSTAEKLKKAGCRVLLAVDNPPLQGIDLCVVSPGIPLESDWCLQVMQAGIPLVAEIELAFRFCSVPVLGVTGSKGKSTAVKLAADILRTTGLNVAIGGNYGKPLSTLVMESDADLFVVECSSFQLETTKEFAPDAGILLNIQPDHLDRHATMEQYSLIKKRLFSAQSNTSLAVVPVGMEGHIPGDAACLTFGTGSNADAVYRAGRIVMRNGDIIDITGTYFDNPVLGVAVAAVCLAVQRFGAVRGDVEKAVRDFVPLSHRMQLVAVKNGVSFINDSKATSLSATAAALQMSPGPVRLIAGGRLKEKNVVFLKEILEKHCLGVYCIGEAEEIMVESWQDSCLCEACMNLEQAFEKACRDSRAGECVLLSPGCASYDQFKSFEERGNRFIELVSTYR